jgi:PHD/YefM family antitoxin component YafN of YafNO toxin-antitoxin module
MPPASMLGSESVLRESVDWIRVRSTQTMAIQEQFVVDSNGKKTGVILPLKRYQRLMEDLHDLAVVAERRSEAPISLEEMKRRLKKDGVL